MVSTSSKDWSGPGNLSCKVGFSGADLRAFVSRSMSGESPDDSPGGQSGAILGLVGKCHRAIHRGDIPVVYI
jgi:hypothetical protein